MYVCSCEVAKGGGGEKCKCPYILWLERCLYACECVSLSACSVSGERYREKRNSFHLHREEDHWPPHEGKKLELYVYSL